MVIPAGTPWMKSAGTSASGEDRLNMCVAALDDLPEVLQEKVSVSDIEVRRKGQTYTIETINQLRAFYPKDEFVLIVGSDAAASFDKWYRADSLKRQVEFLVVKRPGDEKSEFPETKIDALDISSTQIREALESGQKVDQYLSPSVVAYIKEHRLYGSK
jgi:nicotinate-nucleotide adenylyltransferase